MFYNAPSPSPGLAHNHSKENAAQSGSNGNANNNSSSSNGAGGSGMGVGVSSWQRHSSYGNMSGHGAGLPASPGFGGIMSPGAGPGGNGAASYGGLGSGGGSSGVAASGIFGGLGHHVHHGQGAGNGGQHPNFGLGSSGLGSAHGGGPGQGTAVNGSASNMGILGGNNTGGGHFGSMGSGMNQGAASASPETSSAISGPYWQQQILRAEACRQSSAPHHRARASALASRMVNNKTAVPILDPNKPVSVINSSIGQGHKKAASSVNNLNSDLHDDGATDRTDSPGARAGNANAQVTSSKEEWEPWTGIDLGGIRLKVLAPSLFAFEHITTLYINHNHLTALSPAISNLRHLTHLDATGNMLGMIPPELGLVTTLKELLLFDNQLVDLPLELGTLYQLEFLGIEGNPLSDTIRHAMAEKGTSGLIAYFRDNCPPPAAPPSRKWEMVEDDPDTVDAETDHASETFSLMSYNILADRYAPATMYGYTPSWALDWQYRKDAIMAEISDPSLDIICLQEVEDEVFHEFLLPRLTEMGYEGAFSQKTRARTMSKEERRKVDGCATFWKSNKYQLIEQHVIEFNRLALSKADMRTDDMFNRIMPFDNISSVCLLESRATDSRLIIANAHIHWDPVYRDVKLVQVAMLVDEVDKIGSQFARLPPKRHNPDDPASHGRPPVPVYSAGTDIPIIICGDYNSEPHSAVYDFFSRGEVPAGHEDFMSHEYGQYTSHGMSHRLGLRSAYANIGELPLTNHTPGFAGAIDYIWYSQANMSVTSLLGEVDKDYIGKVVGFPNPHFPSE